MDKLGTESIYDTPYWKYLTVHYMTIFVEDTGGTNERIFYGITSM